MNRGAGLVNANRLHGRMGAIASGGVRVRNDGVVRWCRIPDSAIDAVTQAELAELARREREYRDDRPYWRR